jgi:hypothetical protein
MFHVAPADYGIRIEGLVKGDMKAVKVESECDAVVVG